jgi:hypothetical protein
VPCIAAVWSRFLKWSTGRLNMTLGASAHVKAPAGDPAEEHQKNM